MKTGDGEVYGVIYKIRNKVNNKIYIGQTTRKRGFNDRYCFKGEGIERVYNYHIALKKYNGAYNNHLIKSIEKYGFDNFEVDEEFDIAKSEYELNSLEYLYIKTYKTTNRKYGYNFKDGGDSGKFSEDSKTKIGVTVVCLNDGKIFKSMQEASLYYNISISYIKKTIFGKYYKRNFPLIRFRKITYPINKMKNERLCINCGNKFSRRKNNRRLFCKKCSELNKKGKIEKIKVDLTGLNIKKVYYYKDIVRNIPKKGLNK